MKKEIKENKANDVPERERESERESEREREREGGRGRERERFEFPLLAYEIQNQAIFLYIVKEWNILERLKIYKQI